MEFAFDPTPSGWIVRTGDLIIEAENPYRDKGVVRSVLTVRREQKILHRDTVNLTSERTRAKFRKKLAEKDIELDERILVALDEACRTPRPRQSTPTSVAESDIAAAPPLDLAGLQAAFGRWLLIEDEDFLPVLTGSFLAHRLRSDPVWLLLVAPPGGTKSETLRSFFGLPNVFPLSDLTPRTFASGLDTATREPSLLARLSDEILVLKDFTTVLEMQCDARREVLAQLREIYDGRFDKVWGTGRELHWEGHLGFIAGVTPIIDRHQGAMSILGERFILFRLTTPDRTKMASAALRGGGKEAEMRKELATAMIGFLRARKSDRPRAGDTIHHTLASVADFVTRARSGVIRDGYRRELEYAPEPEAPTRFAKVLLALACGIALAYDSLEITGRELRLVQRVALDCLPVIRRRVIKALVESTITDDDDDGTLSTSAIAGSAQFSTSAIRRALEDLQALSLVTRSKQGAGKADLWELKPNWREAFSSLHRAAERPLVDIPDPLPDKSGTVVPEPDGTSDRSGTVVGTFPEMSGRPSGSSIATIPEM